VIAERGWDRPSAIATPTSSTAPARRASYPACVGSSDGPSPSGRHSRWPLTQMGYSVGATGRVDHCLVLAVPLRRECTVQPTQPTNPSLDRQLGKEWCRGDQDVNAQRCGRRIDRSSGRWCVLLPQQYRQTLYTTAVIAKRQVCFVR
jgi:hypothetical protein